MPNSPLHEVFLQFLKADRQWPRRHRVAHARFMLTKSNEWGRDYRLFWTAVLKANGAKA